MIKITIGHDPIEEWAYQELRDARKRFDWMWKKENRYYRRHSPGEWNKRIAAYLSTVAKNINLTCLIDHEKIYDLKFFVISTGLLKK